MTTSVCDSEVVKRGRYVCTLDGPSNNGGQAIETWVQTFAKETDARLDWHYSGGRAVVLHLGDDATHQCVREVLRKKEYKSKDGVRILD